MQQARRWHDLHAHTHTGTVLRRGEQLSLAAPRDAVTATGSELDGYPLALEVPFEVGHKLDLLGECEAADDRLQD